MFPTIYYMYFHKNVALSLEMTVRNVENWISEILQLNCCLKMDTILNTEFRNQLF